MDVSDETETAYGKNLMMLKTIKLYGECTRLT